MSYLKSLPQLKEMQLPLMPRYSTAKVGHTAALSSRMVTTFESIPKEVKRVIAPEDVSVRTIEYLFLQQIMMLTQLAVKKR